MTTKTKTLLSNYSFNPNYEVITDDINNIELSNASIILLNFTLQFIHPEERGKLISKIYNALIPGGILLLSEKIDFINSNESDFQIKMHHEFKKQNGYSKLEISQKRRALENVMIPDSKEEHINRLTHAGFSNIHLWFQYFNFISIAAIK